MDVGYSIANKAELGTAGHSLVQLANDDGFARRHGDLARDLLAKFVLFRMIQLDLDGPETGSRVASAPYARSTSSSVLARGRTYTTKGFHYERSLYEQDSSRDGKKNKPDITRLQACEAGVASRPKPQMWTGSVSNACLRELWELERDETVRASYARGLAASAEFAAVNKLSLARDFDNDSGKPYDGDWRKLNHLWRPQKTSGEASGVSEPQRSLKNKNSPRSREEGVFVRESAFAAWIVTLCPDRQVVAKHRAAILETLTHFRYDRLNLSTFFALESAWWRLQVGG